MGGAGIQDEGQKWECMSLESFRSAIEAGATVADHCDRDSSDLRSFVSSPAQKRVRVATATWDQDDDLCDWSEPEKVEETTPQRRSRWRKEMMGEGSVAWKREDLETAVTSTCILECTLLAGMAANEPKPQVINST